LLVDSLGLQKSFDGVFSFTLLDAKTSQFSANPGIKFLEYGWEGGTLKIVKPASQHAIQFLDDLFQADAPVPFCDFSDFVLKSLDGTFCNGDQSVRSDIDTKEFSVLHFICSTFGLIDLKL